MPYVSPGGAFTSAFEQHFLDQAENARRDQQMKIEQERETRLANYQQMEMQQAAETLRLQREKFDVEAQDRKLNKITKRIDESFMGDVPDATFLKEVDESGLGHLYPVDANSGIRAYAGSRKEREDKKARDDAAAFAATLPEGPEKDELQFYGKTGRTMPATAIRTNRPTAEEDKQKYIDIQTKARMGRPVAPQEKAWASSYAQAQTLGPATSAAAADTRQSTAEDFQRKEAGRKILTSDIDAKWAAADRKTKAILDVVNAAKSGNQMAGNVQSLLATFGVTTIEGLNRVNMPEIQTVAGAGSLLNRIRGRLSGLTSGQPLTPELQKDLTQLAGIMRKGAYNEYKSRFHSTVKRYGLDDEEIQPEPKDDESETSEDSSAGGVPAVGSTFNGGKVLSVKRK